MKIGFIGGGNMASAIIGGMVEKKVYAPEQIMASGKDILGEEILKRGEPVYGEVKALLPKLETGAFAFLSGALGWCGMVIRADSGLSL